MSADTHVVDFLRQQVRQLTEERDTLAEEVDALQRYLRALEALNEAVLKFAPRQDVLRVLGATLDCALRLLDAEDGSVMLLDDENDELVFVVVRGAAEETLLGFRFPSDEGVAGWVAEKGKPLIVNDAYADLRFLFSVDDFVGFKTQRLIAVPLMVPGKVLGVVEALNKRSGAIFTQEDADMVAVLATLAATGLAAAAPGLAD